VLLAMGVGLMGGMGLALSYSFASLSRLARRLASSLACSASSFFKSFSGSAMVKGDGHATVRC